MRKITISRTKPENLLKILQEEEISLPAYCGGQAACGKCRVRFLNNPPEIFKEEQDFFSQEELARGWRLACRHTVEGTIHLETRTPAEEEIVAATDFRLSGERGAVSKPADAKEQNCRHCQEGVGRACLNRFSTQEREIVAVDIGTTTVAAAHIDKITGEIRNTAAMVNHQRAYGADVISRINASISGKGELLQRCIEDDLKVLLHRLSLSPAKSFLLISANTTMQHLLQGYPCDTLGAAPYAPRDISLHLYKNMLILPGVSAFIGADIVSGIAACGLDLRDEISVLIDLGTNGEMVIGNKDRLLAASAAAGPAFEGGNISCGMAGVPGAISSVTIEKTKDGENVSLSTIGGGTPLGLCGTGVLETVSELLRNEIMDRTGLLTEAYFEKGYPLTDTIRFQEKDIREVQMAKAAIRTGLEILMEEYGVSEKNIGRVYIAGGFGQKINSKKAARIGLFPKEFTEKTTAVGNSSLAGAVCLARNPEVAKRSENIAAKTREINLAAHPDFNNRYIDFLSF